MAVTAPPPPGTGSADGATPGRRGRGRTVAIVVLNLVVLVAVAVALDVRGRIAPDVHDRPADVELPPVTGDQQALRAYFDGTGAPLLDFEREVRPLADGAIDDPDGCLTAIDTLDSSTPPEVIFAAAAGIPDADTADMALAHFDTAVRYLRACAAGEEPDRDALRFATVVWQRRLDELGVGP